MTGIRVYAQWASQSDLATEGTTFKNFPAGMTCTYTPSNNLTTYKGIGNRYIEGAVAGKFSGTWSVKFNFDYENIDFLKQVFKYEFDKTKSIHKFTKPNGTRCTPFTLKIYKQNKVVGGALDQTITLIGCCCSSFSINQTSGGALITVSASGEYVNEKSDITKTVTFPDNTAKSEPAEWSCLLIQDGDDTSYTRVAYSETSSFTITSGLNMMLDCGSRFNGNYYEGMVNTTLSTNVYSSDPRNYYLRMYSGGNVKKDGSDKTYEVAPKTRGLAPISKMKIATENADKSKYLEIKVEDVWVASMNTYSFSPDSKIVDTPNLTVQKFDCIEIKNSVKNTSE